MPRKHARADETVNCTPRLKMFGLKRAAESTGEQTVRSLRQAQDAQQLKTFTRWWNSWLSPRVRAALAVATSARAICAEHALLQLGTAGQKSNLGLLKSPSLRRWIMKLVRVKNTYATRK